MDHEETTITTAVNAAVEQGVLHPDLCPGVIDMCRKAFADMRAQGQDTSAFAIDISRRNDYELDVRIRPADLSRMGPVVASGSRTDDQLLGTHRANGKCDPGECVCEWKGQEYPVIVKCAEDDCPIPWQEVPTFDDAPAWTRVHRLSGCTSQQVAMLPKPEALRRIAAQHPEGA